MKRTIAFAISIGILGSVTSIVLAYTDWYLIDLSLTEALAPVWKWPLFGMSFLLTALSFSVPFVAHFFRRGESVEGDLLIYAFAYLWLPFFIFYPGVRALDVESDGAAAWAWLGVCFFQYVAARLVFSAIEARSKTIAGAA